MRKLKANMNSVRHGDGTIEIVVSRNPSELRNIRELNDYILKYVLGRIYIEDEDDEIVESDPEDEESLSNLAMLDLEKWCLVVSEGLQAFAELKDIFPRLYDAEYSHTSSTVREMMKILNCAICI